MQSLADLTLRRPRNMDLPTLGRDALAGVISAVVQIAYCISFAALIFTGDLASGFSLGLAGLVMGTVVTCVIIAVTSTFSPAIGGPDSPAVAVMSVLAASIATALAAKGANTPQIIINVLVALSVSTLLTGVLLYGIGALKLGQGLRFVPYPVIAGFLAASGLLLITGGMEVVTQTNLTLSPSSWQLLYSPLYGPQIFLGVLFAIAIPVLGRWVPDYLALPIAFFAFLIILDVSLFGFVSDQKVRSAWFLPKSRRIKSMVAHQCHNRPAHRLGRDRPEQRRDRLLLRRDGHCSPARCFEPRSGAPEDRRSRPGIQLQWPC